MFFNSMTEKARKKQRAENARNIVIGATVGTAMGAALGILFAPKAGRETRHDIAERTSEAIDQLRENIEDARERIEAAKIYMVENTQARVDRVREAKAQCQEALKSIAESEKKTAGGKSSRK